MKMKKKVNIITSVIFYKYCYFFLNEYIWFMFENIH